MNKEVWKCHQATFWALPVTTELTAAGTPHSALAPLANYVKLHYIRTNTKLVIC